MIPALLKMGFWQSRNDMAQKLKAIFILSIPIFLSSSGTFIITLLCVRILGYESSENLYVLGLFLPIHFLILSANETFRACIFSFSNASKLKKLKILIFYCFIFYSFSFFLILNVGSYFLNSFSDDFFLKMLLASSFGSLGIILNTFLCKEVGIFLPSCISIVFNIMLFLLTYFFGVYLRLGLEGYILATFFSGVICAGFSLYGLKKENFFAYYQALFFKREDLRRILTIGKILFPIACSYATLWIALFAFNVILSFFDPLILSSFGLAYRAQSLILLPSISIGTALSLIHQAQSSPSFLRLALLISIFFYFTISILSYFFRVPLGNILSNNPIISTKIAEFFRIIGPSYLGLGPLITYITYLEQNGKARKSLRITALYFIGAIGMGGSLSLLFNQYRILFNFLSFSNFLGFLFIIFILKKGFYYA